MKTRIYSQDLNDMLLEAKYPKHFKDANAAVLERTFSADIFIGKGEYKELFFEGVHIGYGNLELSKNTIFNFESDFETVEMHFAINGKTKTVSDCFKKDILFSPGSHNIFYTKGFTGESQWFSKTTLRVFEVNMTPTFFRRYFPDGHRLFDCFRKAMFNEKTAILSEENYPITLEMYSIIEDIVGCKRQGLFKRIFMEAKITELLLLQLEQITASNSNQGTKGLKKEDVEKMYAVKELLDKNFKKTDTLVELAKRVGTNEYTLKKGFKELFGVSVFQYWNGLRL